MDTLTTAMARAADTLSESLAAPRATGSQTRYGTVVANNGSTLDVAMAGGTIAGVPMTTACCSAVAGDRVLLDVTGPLVTATGILANSDNGPYVKSGTLYESGDGYIRWGQQGHVVTVWANYIHAEPSIVKYGPLPKEAWPAVEALGCGYVRGLASSGGQVVVDPDGYVGIYCTQASSYFAGSVAYFVD